MGEKRVAEKRGERKLISARYAAHRPPVVPVVAVGRPDARAIEVEVVSIITTDDRTGPVVAVRCCIVQRAIVDVAGPHKPQRGFA